MAEKSALYPGVVSREGLAERAGSILLPRGRGQAGLGPNRWWHGLGPEWLRCSVCSPAVGWPVGARQLLRQHRGSLWELHPGSGGSWTNEKERVCRGQLTGVDYVLSV